jgi:hypothetical protein
MSLDLRVLNVSASNIATFNDCAARLFHEHQRYPDGLLPTDQIPATVSTAVHDALMNYHRQIGQELRLNRLPTIELSRARLRRQIEIQFWRRRLDRSDSAIAARLGKLAEGIDRAADLVLEGADRWAIDSNGSVLAWVENKLDHGPEVQAIELAPGFLVRTRPDVLGIRVLGDGQLRILVRDYKAKKDVIDPAFDTGILLRAIWTVLELRNPRCRWFLTNRNVQVDADHIDLETVNVMHPSDGDFLRSATLGTARILEFRDQFIETMCDMAPVLETQTADEVLASPNGLCHNWCSFMNRCAPGMDHVRMYYGEDVLRLRLAQA